METNEKPDWVNDVPERYGADWPEERRCMHEFWWQWEYHGRKVEGRPCGYPAEHGQECCIFHREDDTDVSGLRAEIEEAVADGVHLGEAKLAGVSLLHANLAGARLSHADLSEAALHDADLSGAELTGANLSGAKLWQANLAGGTLRATDFSGASLWHANLSTADLQSANLTGADLRWADLSGSNLRYAFITDAQLLWARITADTDHDGVMWRPDDQRSFWREWLQIGEPTLRDEREALDAPHLNGAERLYRQIRRCYQESGDYETAGHFFVREMECKRKQLPRWSLMRPVYHVLHFLSDYFENPWRVVVIGALVMLLWGVVQGAVGVHLPANGVGVEGPTVAGPGFGSFDWPSLQAFGRALYFSAITFTATGYGDYVPAHGWGQFLAATESLIGVFMMATFLVCLARKFGRA